MRTDAALRDAALRELAHRALNGETPVERTLAVSILLQSSLDLWRQLEAANQKLELAQQDIAALETAP